LTLILSQRTAALLIDRDSSSSSLSRTARALKGLAVHRDSSLIKGTVSRDE
jgi:hypothetical protein